MVRSSNNVLLLGLSESACLGLSQVLTADGKSVHARRFLPGDQNLQLIDQLSACVVFCAAEPELYRPLLAALQRRPYRVPVVVVGQAEVSEWLDAIEAGASDYCAPPFDGAVLNWIIQSAAKARPRASAHGAS
jgi:DNA-binding NtrC family response regulator